MRVIFTDPKGNKEVFRHVILRVLEEYDDRPMVNGKGVPAELLFLDDDDTVEYDEDTRFLSAFLSEKDIGPAPEVSGYEKDNEEFDLT